MSSVGVLRRAQCDFSVGVSGVMTGRSVSPTGSSAVKTKSLGTTETSDANSSHSQLSGQDECQQRQRDLHKTQEKVDNRAEKIFPLSFVPQSPNVDFCHSSCHLEAQQKTSRDLQLEQQPVGLVVR